MKELNNLTFEVNEKKKACACTLHACGRNFVGVAKCSHDDVWDVEKGKDISKYRAILKMKQHQIDCQEIVISELRDCLEYATNISYVKTLLGKLISDESNKLGNFKKKYRDTNKKLKSLF